MGGMREMVVEGPLKNGGDKNPLHTTQPLQRMKSLVCGHHAYSFGSRCSFET